MFDLGVIGAALRTMDPKELEDWIRREPTGAFSRRAWFLYERFSGRLLDVPDAKMGNYVHALDPRHHVGLERRLNSRRHLVIDNLLGESRLCPTVRRTHRIDLAREMHIDAEARQLLERFDPVVLARAVNYLFTKETRSSFAIEGEKPSASRTERFVNALRQAPDFDPTDESELVRLQNNIVDPRYAESAWRDLENFVGETVAGYREEVHFICPRPEDVEDLMAGWKVLYERTMNGLVDPVVTAALIAFAFVFIHPFEDGNSRIHRFLIHHVLAKRGFAPEQTIFPVSAAIVRERHMYAQVLESFSKPIFDYIDWDWTTDMEVVVRNETIDLYRYFDATPMVEYLYDRIVDTVRVDLKDELGFVSVFDKALAGVREIVDVPDRRASLLVRLIMQNGGRLSKRKRVDFEELTDEEVS